MNEEPYGVVCSMWSKIRNVISLPSVISAIPLIIVVTVGGYLSYRYNMILKNNRDLVVHTYQLISAVERAFSDIQDAETGQRGFIITGDEKYLDPYKHALQTMPEFLPTVRQLIVDRPDQLERLDKLEAALQRKTNELTATIALRRKLGIDAARAAIVQADGKAAMDRIRAIVAEMIAIEKDLLADRTSRVAYDERNVVLIALFGAGASIATRVVVAFVVRRRERAATHRLKLWRSIMMIDLDADTL
jgi:CHASE3 domain sensor protein